MKQIILIVILALSGVVVGQDTMDSIRISEWEWLDEQERNINEYIELQRNSLVYDFKEGDNDLIHTKGLLKDIFHLDVVKKAYGDINPRINFILVETYTNGNINMHPGYIGTPFFQWVMTLNLEDYPVDKFIFEYNFILGNESLTITEKSTSNLVRKIDITYDNLNSSGEYQNLRTISDIVIE